MDLKIKDISELLKVPEKTVLQWIKEDKIPFHNINKQYRFSKSEINDWILQNKIQVSEKILNINISKKPVNLVELLKRGGIHFGLNGSDVVGLIKNAVEKIDIPKEITKEAMLASLIERESMMPTAMGRGVAFPHPRNPIIAEAENESVSLFRLNSEIDYKALDGKPVHTLFILLTSSPQRHLNILARLSFLCQDDAFISLLKRAAREDEILCAVEQKEKQWEKLQD